MLSEDNMSTVSINVEGMKCQNCVKSISEELNGIDGVQKAEISLEGKTVDVQYDENKASVEDLRNAIYELGFDVK